jgi:hypothetical protein
MSNSNSELSLIRKLLEDINLPIGFEVFRRLACFGFGLVDAGLK